jgi:hypothetical protein
LDSVLPGLMKRNPAAPVGGVTAEAAPASKDK